MKRKILLLSLILILVTTFLMNQYIQMVFHMNIFQYFGTRHQLTQEDRAYLKAHGPIIYGADNNAPPLRFYDTESEQYKGIVIDFLQALAIELETEIRFEPMVWEDALKALEAGETDICDMYPSKERSEKFIFSDPVYYQRGIILARADDYTVKQVADLEGKRVGIQKGDYVYEFLKSTGYNIHYFFGPDYEANLEMFRQGEVDYIVGDEPVISYFLNAYNLTEQYRIVDEPLYELPSVFSMPTDHKKMQTIINKGIYALNETRIIEKIQQKWFGISTPIGSDQTGPRVTLFIMGASFFVSMIVLLIILWNLELKKAVDAQTRALIASKNQLQTMIDGLEQAIVVITEEFKILSTNRQFNLYFERTGMVRFDLLMPHMTEAMKEGLIYLQRPCELILKGRTCKITPHKIEYSAHPMATYLLIIEDITDKKVNEARLLQENKMAAVGQLATGVAHEIRNPLGLIRNYMFLLRKQSPTEPMLIKAISVIEESVDKASNIIDNLLNFSRLSDEVDSEVALKPFIEKIIDLNDKLMNRSRLSYQLILEEVSIHIKEESLKHILINLINNSIDAMTDGGQLTIWLYKKEGQVNIHIIDRGEGMSEETLNKLYDPFFTTKKVGEGTGLGLYIAFNELQKNDGEIKVISKINTGTTFKLQFRDKQSVGGGYETRQYI